MKYTGKPLDNANLQRSLQRLNDLGEAVTQEVNVIGQELYLQGQKPSLKENDLWNALHDVESELSHILSDTGSFGDAVFTVRRIEGIRNKLRDRLRALGYRGNF